MTKMMFLSKNWYFSVQKALIYYTVNKSHYNSFILLVFSHVANFRYVAYFIFLTLHAFAKLFTLQVLLLEHGSKPLTNQLFGCKFLEAIYNWTWYAVAIIWCHCTNVTQVSREALVVR